MIKNKSNFFISLGLFVICAILTQQISLLPDTSSGAEFFGPASFPKGVNSLLFIFTLILFVNSLREPGIPATWPQKDILIKVLLMICLVLCYVFGFVFGGAWAYDAMLPEGSGFSAATFIFLAMSQVLMGHRKIVHLLLISAIITASLYVIFALLFKVPLP